jgi:hypothetical protein
MIHLSNDTYKQDYSPRAALETLERHLLHENSKSGDYVTRAISRVQCVNALQVILDFANEEVLQPEESYRLTADYEIGNCSTREVPIRKATNFDSVMTNYDRELILLYQNRIRSDSIFDDDSFIHGHNCKCCTICYDDPSRRFEEYKRK